MAEYRLSEEAQNDLRKIQRYTLETWGKDQAKQYLIELALKFEQLAAMPGLGREREDIKVGVRSFRVRHHTLYYREKPNGIEIVRVLHPSMDVEQNFEQREG